MQNPVSQQILTQEDDFPKNPKIMLTSFSACAQFAGGVKYFSYLCSTIKITSG